MKISPKWLALLSFILGCAAIVFMIIWPVEIYTMNPPKTTYYDIISLITSPDFNTNLYSKIALASRTLPLICTIMLIIGTILTIFYKNRKCVILCTILMLTASILSVVAKIALEGESYTVITDWESSKSLYISILTRYYITTPIAFFSSIPLIYANNLYRKENGLLRPWEK